MGLSSLVLGSAFALITYFIVRCLSAKQTKHALPPGPKGLPLLGNLNDLPKPVVFGAHHWLKHKDLYG